jgi:hypothetical protein
MKKCFVFLLSLMLVAGDAQAFGFRKHASEKADRERKRLQSAAEKKRIRATKKVERENHRLQQAAKKKRLEATKKAEREKKRMQRAAEKRRLDAEKKRKNELRRAAKEKRERDAQRYKRDCKRKKQERARQREQKRARGRRNREAREGKRRIQAEQRRLERAQKQREHREMLLVQKHDRKKLADKKQEYKAQQLKLESEWRKIRGQRVAQDYADGKYADLYFQPAWPTYATYLRHKHLLNVGFDYQYATDFYGNRGDNMDITKGEFGEETMHLRDISLASKLVSCGVLQQLDGDIGNGVFDQSANQYLRYLADSVIHFLGESESWRVNCDLSRHIWKCNLVAGVHIPFVYKKHRLKCELRELSDEARAKNPTTIETGLTGLVEPIPSAGVAVSPSTFHRRYGADTKLFLRDLFKAKGFDELGGSSAGFGDIQAFLHTNFSSAWFQNLMLGVNFTFPTTQRKSMCKLWAPELGNGGFFETAFFGNIVIPKEWWFNPHLFLQVSTTIFPAHVQRRTPKRIQVANTAQASEFHRQTSKCINNAFALANRVDFDQNSNDPTRRFDEFDTCFKNIGDNIARFKMQKGSEFVMRLGNMVKNFILRRAFLDLYWDFRAKLRDWVTCLDVDVWDTNIYNRNSHQIENRAGLEWSYQFDQGTRFRAGVIYTFNGVNVPKTFQVSANMNYSF